MKDLLDGLTPGSRLVLDILWRNGPLPRAHVASIAGFTRAAVTNIADELIERGLIAENEPERGKRGQPARPLALNGSAGYAVGITFSTSFGEVGILDFAGKVIGRSTFPLTSPTPELIGESASVAIKLIATRCGLARKRQVGVGIAIPADFDTDGIALPHRLFPDLAGAGLAERFTQGLNLPVILENDGRSSAIGERLLGVGAAYGTFMLVHLGHGVGGGLIIDGKPYRGALGNAGILGQYYPYGQPRPSGFDLLETLQANGFDAQDFDWLDSLPDDCDAVVDAWVNRSADQLSGDLARISRFFGPEAVILAGRLPSAILDRLREAIDFEAVLRPMDNLPITPVLASRLGAAAGVIGAAAVPILDALSIA